MTRETAEKRRQRYLRDRDKEIARKRQWRKDNKAKQAAYDRQYKMLRKFGITPQQYDKILQSQGGVCAVCEGVDANGRMLAVDHCHDTGQIRGLLCSNCNTAIGKLGDNAAGVGRALTYLLRCQP